MVRKTALALALALVAMPARAASPVDAPATAARVAADAIPLALTIDGVDEGLCFVVERDGDVLVPLADLRRAKLAVPPGVAASDAGGETYVSLRALAPLVRYTIDENTLVLALIVDPALLPSTDIDLVVPKALPQANAVPSGFANYTFSSAATRGARGALGAYLETGAGSNRGVFDSSLATEGDSLRRGLTNFTTETPSTLRRTAFGDAVADAGTLGGSLTLGGVSVERAFDLQPQFLRQPTPGIAGTVLVPTSADVYVNGVFVRSVALQPGSYDLNQLGAQSGANATSVVLHDANGTTSLDQTLYLDADTLRPGVTDYQYAVGFARPDPFGFEDRYGPLALLARYRAGISNAVTVGGRIEARPGLASVGPRIDVALPAGALSLFAAASDSGGISGSAFAVAYTFESRGVGAGASVTKLSPSYANLSLLPAYDRRLSEVDENVSLPVSRRTSLAVTNSNVIDRDRPAQTSLTGSLQTTVTRAMSLRLFAERIRGGVDDDGTLATAGTQGPVVPVVIPGGTQGPRNAWTLGASLFFAGRSDVDAIATTQTTNGTAANGILVQKAAPQGPGFGYRIEADSSGGTTTSFEQAALQTDRGDVLVDAQVGGAASDSVSTVVSGGVAVFKQGVTFTRPLDGPYALVHVDGLANAPIDVNNVFAGRTDGRGLLVTTNVTPYLPNAVALGDLGSLPDVRDAGTHVDVVPKNRTAALADLVVRRVRFFTGTMTIGAGTGEIVPRYGVVDLAGAGWTFRSDLGSTGEFYFEDVPSGTYDATIQYAGGTCRFSVRFPVARTLQTDLGRLTCALP